MMIYDIDINLLGFSECPVRNLTSICRCLAGRTEMAGEDRTKSASLRRALVSCLAKFYEGK